MLHFSVNKVFIRNSDVYKAGVAVTYYWIKSYLEQCAAINLPNTFSSFCWYRYVVIPATYRRPPLRNEPRSSHTDALLCWACM